MGRADRAHRWGAGRVIGANIDSGSTCSSVDKHLEIERSATAEEEQVSSRFETLSHLLPEVNVKLGRLGMRQKPLPARH